MKKLFPLILIVFTVTPLRAQQISLNTLYNQNHYLINPAAVGFDSCFKAYLGHRNQWVGINESPARNFLTLDGRLGKHHGLGLNAQMYQAGLLSNFDLKLSYAYHFNLGENSSFSLGLSAGMIQQRFAMNEAIASDYDDNALLQGNQSDIGFTSEVGMLLKLKQLQLGLSVPQVFANGIQLSQGSTNEQDFKLVQHFNVFASYGLISSDNWKLNPFILYRNAVFVGHQLDAGARLAWRNTLGIGAMYRTSYGIAAMADVNIGDKFRLAYSYGFGTTNDITGISKGTHEIMIGIKICKKPKTREKIVEDSIPEDTVKVVEDPIVEDTTKTEDPVVEDLVVEEDSIVETPVVEPKPLDLDSLNRVFNESKNHIHFELSSSTIHDPKSDKTIDEVVEILKSNPDLNITLEGHTCDRGTSDLNDRIANDRANSVAKRLRSKGISADRIKTVGYGENQPFVPNTNKDNQRKNRRVRVIFKR